MATLLKPTRPFALPANAKLVEKDGKPYVRIGDGRKAAIYPLTNDRKKYLKPSEKWYAKYRNAEGVITLTPLSPNKDAAQVMLTALLKRIEDQKSGIRSDFADHRTRTLPGLLAEYEQHAIDRDISEKQAKQTHRRCEKVLAHEAVGVDRGRPSSVRTMPATPTLLYAHWKTATYWWR
ncbi:hypothetical protein FTUN_0075 [Frigoriglobus tundricola]|uniref:Uncharacterized protein n=1 Tax=Frigoriglobus tundricola TaxID=2774151 RepID=A0A6M5YF07_9BACT|nr:hypothetical protein FTUN_0075 [Frigoriglobus tundricola]